MSLSVLFRRALLSRRFVSNVTATGSIARLGFEGLKSTRSLSYTQLLRSTETATIDKAAHDEKSRETEKAKATGTTTFKGREVQEVPVETSIKYLQSKAYSITYGSDPVWKNYRRNFKGSIPPRKTRKTCIRENKISTGNPCPICRDDYLVLSPENPELLKQFISPHTGQTHSYLVTGVCQKKHKVLLSAIDIAKDRGLITFDVPFRAYDYSEYKK